MHVWNTKALEGKLKSGSVTQGQYCGYLLFNALLTVVVLEVTGYFPEEPSIEAIVSSCVVILSTLLGIIVCYNANRKGDNRDFVGRYVSLSIPIGIRITVLFVVFFAFYLVVGYSFAPQEFGGYLDKTSIADILFIAGFSALFYTRLYLSIKRVAAGPS